MEYLRKLCADRSKVRLAYIDVRGHWDELVGHIVDPQSYAVLFQEEGTTKPIYIYHHRIVTVQEL
jgi:hypothetical protein